MKNTPTLVIMAAGLGSRFGGLKQIAPIDDDGNIIIDFSVYDAKKAGFSKIVCIINPANENDFRSHFKNTDIVYAHQTMDMLPEGFEIPEGRVKPWGTAHAILSAADNIDGPFAVINADDFYGLGSFQLVHGFLAGNSQENKYAVVGYRIENTITDSGSVARGVLNMDGGRLLGIEEMLDITRAEGGAVSTKDGKTTMLPAGTLGSMNMWGFQRGLLDEIRGRFPSFLQRGLAENPLKCEFLLPTLVGDLLVEEAAQVDVLPSVEKWYGVTYAQDMPGVKAAIQDMKERGCYPIRLWG